MYQKIKNPVKWAFDVDQEGEIQIQKSLKRYKDYLIKYVVLRKHQKLLQSNPMQ